MVTHGQASGNDDGSNSSSLWLRPLRRFFEEGRPTDAVTVFSFASTPNSPLPFGAFTQTKQRLIFWPVLPRNARMYDDDGQPMTVDHLTLELPSGRTHVTAFDQAGKRHHRSRGWRLHRFADKGLALWFMLFVRRTVIEHQDRWLERQVAIPTSDAARREAEFERYAAHCNGRVVPLPADGFEGDYVYCLFYLVVDSQKDIIATPDVLPHDSRLDEWIDGFPAGALFGIQPVEISVGHTRLVVATATPPGTLKEEISFGFPTATTSGRSNDIT